MTPRSIRRAAERKARKEMQRKERNQMQSNATDEQAHRSNFGAIKQSTTTQVAAAPHSCPTLITAELPNLELPERKREPKPAPTATVSAARLAANRANAQLSTGPTSNQGRAKACLNAVKTALTGRTVLLPSDDAAAYEQHVLAYTKELRPLTQRECDLAQSIADTAWRLKRIPALEIAIYAKGRMEFADTFDDHDASLRPSMIELQTYLTYEKQLRNLQLQEARLARRYDKDTAELRNMQKERDHRDEIDLDAAAKLYLTAEHDNRPFDPTEVGFDFSIEDIESYLEGVRAANIATVTLSKERDAARAKAKMHSQAA